MTQHFAARLAVPPVRAKQSERKERPMTLHPSLESRWETGGVRVPLPPPVLHGKWVLWLILCGATNAEIRRSLADDSLPCPSNAVVNARRAANRTPRGFSACPPFAPETETYLRRLGLERLATGAPETHTALGILRSSRLREVVEAGLIVDARHTAIVDAAVARLNANVDPEAIESFQELFFRTGVLTRAQLEIAVEDRVRVCLAKAASNETDVGTFAQALASDPRVIASTVRRSAKNWPGVLDATR